MKNFYLKLFLFFPLSIFSQIDYGFKAGVNLNNSSNISIISDAFENKITKNDFQGFFIGSYASIDLLLINLRTELQFSKIKNSNDLIQEKIELPITVGYKIMPFLSAYIGPSFQYVLNEKSNTFNLDEVKGKTTMGINIGTRVHLGKLQFDLRYERGLNSLETKLLNESNLNVAKIDTRASLLSMGFSYRIN
tara:strand:- start:2492 stop:3067 length:576 start_codon:yes stop_codon:yes gene_type:complete